MPITLIRGKDRREAVIEHRRLMLDKALELLIEGKASAEYMALRGRKLKEITEDKNYNRGYN